MNEMMDYLKEAMNKNAHELFLAPQVPPRYRLGRQWVNLGMESLKAAQTKESLLQVISDEERQKLFEKGSAEGLLHIHGKSINFSLSLSAQGLCGHFHWIESSHFDLQSWGFPLYVSEIIAKGSGLSVITGSRRSGKTSAIGAIVKDLAQKKRAIISIFSDQDEIDLTSQESVICSYHSSYLKGSLAQAEASDLVVIDTKDPLVLKCAVELSERGVNVLCAISAHTVQAALERLSELIEENPAIGLKRISHCLQMGIGLKLIPGIDAVLVPAFELLMGTSSVRRELRENNWSDLEMMMSTTGDRTGMRTMNQALLQLILKRKIELRVGFEESSRPDELDQMLKKVGF
ncbi:MAG: hypothetical protein BroJett040_14910 [Oligoflexia bacterium]|nr:MAG: hypothetical protein BroJett040_14910 [Oligoflexia bacterium]